MTRRFKLVSLPARFQLTEELAKKFVQYAERAVNIIGVEPIIRVDDCGGSAVYLIFAWPADLARHGNVVDSISLNALHRHLNRHGSFGALWIGLDQALDEFIIWCTITNYSQKGSTH